MTVKVGGLTGFPTGADYHLADQVAMLHTGPLATRSGVIAGLDLVKTAGMDGTITPGQAWVAGTSGAAQGGYPFTVTAAEPISFAPGDATRDRIDLVVGHVYENVFDSSEQTVGVIEVVQGAYPSSGQPVEPALPANSVRLFAQRINAGTSAGSGGFNTALTTNRRDRAVAHGGLLPLLTAGAPPFSGVYEGQRAVDSARQEWEWRTISGTAQWTWPKAAQGTLLDKERAAAQLNIGVQADVTNLSGSVTVPAGRRLKISATVPVTIGTAASNLEVHIYEGAGPTLVDKVFVSGSIGAAGTGQKCTGYTVVRPAAGTYTYKVTMVFPASPNGNNAISAAATSKALLTVEDIGAA